MWQISKRRNIYLPVVGCGICGFGLQGSIEALSWRNAAKLVWAPPNVILEITMSASAKNFKQYYFQKQL